MCSTAREIEAATQPLCQSGCSSYSATQSLRVARQPLSHSLRQSGWGSHSATCALNQNDILQYEEIPRLCEDIMNISHSTPFANSSQGQCLLVFCPPVICTALTKMSEEHKSLSAACSWTQLNAFFSQRAFHSLFHFKFVEFCRCINCVNPL